MHKYHKDNEGSKGVDYNVEFSPFALVGYATNGDNANSSSCAENSICQSQILHQNQTYRNLLKVVKLWDITSIHPVSLLPYFYNENVAGTRLFNILYSNCIKEEDIGEPFCLCFLYRFENLQKGLDNTQEDSLI
ncbi:hypothetical protein SAY86_020197 [Trapa natans]|uniref:Uncharacterized protein n=1 Tax=Trapa natans TaxID=22666 RepID=A0AAN7LIN1_TRANT|nr:hypothetical protein SAY86_020197 [Trapa natans]